MVLELTFSRSSYSSSSWLRRIPTTLARIFTSRWDDKLISSSDCFSLCAKLYLLGGPEADNKHSHAHRGPQMLALSRKNSREMLPKNIKKAQTPRVWINIFFITQRPATFTKKFIVLLAWKSLFCWMNLRYNNERASQHRNFTFIKKRFFAINFFCDISFINLWDFSSSAVVMRSDFFSDDASDAPSSK